MKDTEMNIDPNEFFRQATVRICGSLDIEIALKRMQQYVNQFIPRGINFSDCF